MKRPDSLPDFSDPPLVEVVLGVQFAPVPRYASVHSKGVWELFKNEFPKIAEHSILEPQFETFGGANVQSGPRIQLSGAPIGSRLWFVSSDENNLLQFQPDRFIANWRKQPTSVPYPRYEWISDSLEKNLKKLEKHLLTEFSYEMDINQAEISYINIVPVDDFSSLSEWFNIWDGKKLNFEAFNCNFNEVVKDESGNPIARLKYDLQTAFSASGKDKVFRLSLTYKGKPAKNDIFSAMEFFAQGRQLIVKRFDDLITQNAQQHWGKN